MTDNVQVEYQPATPNPDLKSLDRLVGTWQVSGGAQGQVTYEWLEGGFFLMQRYDLEMEGHPVKGIELIGHLKSFDGLPSEDIKTRIYDNQGNTFDYVYELDGDTLMIWSGEKGSPAYFKGTFSADGNTNTGAWHYPGGGGYESNMTRVQ